MNTIAHNPRRADNQTEIERFISSVARAQISALLLDYDGTLAPFSADRKNALPYASVPGLLQKIMMCGPTRVVIVSGRSAVEVVDLLGMDPVPEVWGSHGFQRLKPDGTSEMPRIEEDAQLAFSSARHWLEQHGLKNAAEFKPGGIAVHWRGLPEARMMEMRDQVLRGWFPIAQESLLSVLEFDGGVEIRVPYLDKGDAVRTVIEELGPNPPIAYLGDDTTDERAFHALGERGLTVLVRPEWRRTSARLWLRPPHELVHFLMQWLNAIA